MLDNQQDRTIPPAEPPIKNLPDSERVLCIRRGFWINYPRAKEILAELGDCLEQHPGHRDTPKRRRRFRGMTLFGPSNNGKTEIIHTFSRQIEAMPTEPDRPASTLLHVDAPTRPDDGALLTQFLNALGDPRASKGSRDDRWLRLLLQLRDKAPLMIVLDEVQNLLAGSPLQSEHALNRLKGLSNELQLPIILVGTEKAAHIVETDHQVLSRYPPFELPRWRLDGKFATLVGRVLGALPLKGQEPLAGRPIERLHEMSDGLLGGLVDVLQRLAIEAIQARKECIDDAAIEAMALRRLQRKR